MAEANKRRALSGSFPEILSIPMDRGQRRNNASYRCTEGMKIWEGRDSRGKFYL